MDRVVRCSNGTPTWASRKATALLTAAAERPVLRLAPARLPSSSAAMNTFMASMRSISSTHALEKRTGLVNGQAISMLTRLDGVEPGSSQLLRQCQHQCLGG